MVVNSIKAFCRAVFQKIKEFVQNPVNFVYLIIGGIIAVILLFSAGAKEIDEYIEENLTERIEFDSDGCGNVYVRDGIIISFKTVYYQNDFIALEVQMINNTKKETTVDASINLLDEHISFSSDENKAEYLIIGDFQYSSYDVNLTLTQGERILADGVVHVTPSAENGVTFTEVTTVYYKPEIQVFYLGTDNENLFMIFDNKTPMDLKVSFENEECGFSLTVPKTTYQYAYISGIGAVEMNMGAFEVTIKEVTAEDIIIEEVDSTE